MKELVWSRVVWVRRCHSSKDLKEMSEQPHRYVRGTQSRHWRKVPETGSHPGYLSNSKEASVAEAERGQGRTAQNEVGKTKMAPSCLLCKLPTSTRVIFFLSKNIYFYQVRPRCSLKLQVLLQE